LHWLDVVLLLVIMRRSFLFRHRVHFHLSVLFRSLIFLVLQVLLASTSIIVCSTVGVIVIVVERHLFVHMTEVGVQSHPSSGLILFTSIFNLGLCATTNVRLI
jgi:hypothetical protein